jgi:hypothetical protein
MNPEPAEGSMNSPPMKRASVRINAANGSVNAAVPDKFFFRGNKKCYESSTEMRTQG